MAGEVGRGHGGRWGGARSGRRRETRGAGPAGVRMGSAPEQWGPKEGRVPRPSAAAQGEAAGGRGGVEIQHKVI